MGCEKRQLFLNISMVAACHSADGIDDFCEFFCRFREIILKPCLNDGNAAANHIFDVVVKVSLILFAGFFKNRLQASFIGNKK